MRVTEQDLKLLARRVGAGDQAAFRRLYALLAPATLVAVRVTVPEVAHAVSVVRATFCEVWRMSAVDRRWRTRHRNVPQWIASIAERRGAERRRALDLIVEHTPSRDKSVFWSGLLAGHDLSMGYELVAMLDEQDTVLLAPCGA
jgi:hypothetical protein